MLNDAEQIEHLELTARLSGLTLPETVLPESHHIVIHGMRFHYLDWGVSGSRPILFLHGGGLNAHTWDVVCLMLRRQYHCFALDQRGHGDSEWEPTSDYSHNSQVRDVAGFIDQLGLQRMVLPARGIRAIDKARMIHNAATPRIEVDPETYEVRDDGVHLTCEPATVLPMAQRYFLY